MPIVLAPIQVKLKILKVLGDEKNKKHLESLGVIINNEIMVLSSSSGNVIVSIKGIRIALDRKIASTIIVG